MSNKSFFGLLTITTVVSLITILGFIQSAKFADYTGFFLATIALFVALSLLIFFLGKKSATSTNNYLFIYLIMGNIFLKFFASIVIVVLYFKLFEPNDRLFLFPFMFIYLIFTIFETYVLSSLAKLKPNKN